MGIGGVVARVSAVVDIDTRELQKGLKEVEHASHQTGSRMGTALKIGAAGAAVGIGLVVGALGESVKSAVEWQKVNARMQVGLKDAGISWKKHGDAIQHTIEKMASASGFTKNDLADAFTNMVRTTGNLKSAHKDLGIAMDVARTKGISLAQAQSLVARVANGSFTGVKKLGISVTTLTANYDKLVHQHNVLAASGHKFTLAETEHYNVQLKAAKAADKHATAMAALATVHKKFAGQASAYAHTYAGEMERLHATVDIVEEKIGSKLLPVLQSVLGWVLKIAGSKQMQQWLDALGKAFDAAGKYIVMAWNYVTAIFKRNQADIMGTLHALQTVFTAVFKILAPIVKVYLGQVVNVVKAAMKVIGDVIHLVMDVLQGHWGKAWGDIKHLVVDTLGFIKADLMGFVTVAGTVAGKIGSAIWGGIKSGASGIGSWVGSQVKSVINYLIGSVDSGLNVISDHWPNFPGAPGPPFGHDPIPKLASGGRVRGGTPGRDSVPALLMPGEIVLNPRQQGYMRANYGVDVGTALGFSAGGSVTGAQRRAAARTKLHDHIDAGVQSKIGGLDFSLQLAGRIASRDDQEGNITGELVQLAKQQRLRLREIGVYKHAMRSARRGHFSDLTRTYSQAAQMIQQDVLDAKDTIKGLQGGGGGGTGGIGGGGDIAAFLAQFMALQKSFGSTLFGSAPTVSSTSDVASPAGGTQVTIHQHVHTKHDDHSAHMRQAKFAAQAVFG